MTDPLIAPVVEVLRLLLVGLVDDPDRMGEPPHSWIDALNLIEELGTREQVIEDTEEIDLTWTSDTINVQHPRRIHTERNQDIREFLIASRGVVTDVLSGEFVTEDDDNA